MNSYSESDSEEDQDFYPAASLECKVKIPLNDENQFLPRYTNYQFLPRYQDAFFGLPKIPPLLSPPEKLNTDQYKIREIINDIFLSNFLDKKSGHAYLIDMNVVEKWMFLRSINYDHMHCIYFDPYETKSPLAISLNIQQSQSILENSYPVMNDILKLANGKMSLAGGSIVDIINGQDYVNDFDVFFHTGNVDEAEILLQQCLNLIDSLDVGVDYLLSQGVQTVEFYYHDKPYKIQFVKRVYETKDQVLLGFDMAPCRMGYNPIDGFFATICGGLAFAMGVFPIDLTQRSFSFGYRLQKYVNKGFNSLLIGLSEDFDELDLKTLDVAFRKHDTKRYNFNDHVNTVSDYDNDSEFINWWFIKTEKYNNVTFKFDNLSEMNKFSDDIIERNIRIGKLFYPPSITKVKKASSIANFLQDKDKIHEFVLAYYVDNNLALADSIWEEASQFYINKAKEVVKIIKENPWKYKDPGSQSFGKFNPIIADPREWYGHENYKPVVVGLSVERLQAFYDCRKNIDYINMLPRETFRIICEWWFVMEALDARNKLLNMCL